MLFSDINLKPLYLNGKNAKEKTIIEMIYALNDKRIRTEKGGYLFKAGSDDENLYLGLIPCMIQGERTHHFDITMPDLEYILVGSITPEGIFTILFIPKQKILSQEMRKGYRSIYIDLSAGLLGRGLNEPGELDMVSRMMLEKAGLMTPAPKSMLDILGQDRSTPRKS